MTATLHKDFHSGSFTREDSEHAYTAINRLRERLQSLSELSAGNILTDRGSSVVIEGANVLKAIACVIQSTGIEKDAEPCLVHCQNGVKAVNVSQVAAALKVRVVRAAAAVIVGNLHELFPTQFWLQECGVYSYLGVPVFDAEGSIIAVAAVFGGRNRSFNDEDTWWLGVAAQLTGDTLAYRALAKELRDLERGLQPNPADPSIASNRAPAEQPKPTVLVIDDDRMINDVLCEFLTMHGYQVEAAFNGVEAVQAFQPAKHSLVITDVAMPLMNGWELIAALRVRAPSLPIILISGYSTGEFNQSYLTKQGVSAVLTKPLDLHDLAAVVSKLLPLAV
jgi:CheY-like chemotaxis protein